MRSLAPRRWQNAALVAACLAAFAFARAPRVVADTLPNQYTDREFWNLTSDFSEESGYFQSDNLLSNEMGYQTVIPELLRRIKPGGVYLGVGPEQNFTYIAALKPKLVFITDIRRGNLHTQLMYKALFELSADRADFVSRLFSKPRPAGLTTKATADDLVNKYYVDTSEALYNANVKAIEDVLTKKHGFPLSATDLTGIEYVYGQFYWWGPRINYSSSAQTQGGRGGGSMATYADLMMQDDGAGVNRGFLGSEETFQFMKDLESRNMVVPFVGDFAGPKALRGEAKYLKDHQATVVAFYLSNVEQYLTQNGVWGSFCKNVAALPLDDSSTFIYSANGGGGGRGGGLGSQIRPMLAEVKQYCPTGAAAPGPIK